MRSRAAVLIAIGMTLVVSSGAASAAPQKSSVMILHGLPGFTADIYLEGELLLDGFEPTAVAGPLEVDPGAYTVDIREVGAPADSEPALSGVLRIPPRSNISAIAHLSGEGEPALSVFRNTFPTLAPGRSFLQVRYLAQGPTIAIQLDGRRLAGQLRPGGDRLVDTTPGSHEIELVSTSASESLVAPEDASLEEGAATIVYVIGSQDGGGLELMVQTLPGIGARPSGILTGIGDAGSARRLQPWAVAVMAAAAAILFVSGRRLVRRRPIRP